MLLATERRGRRFPGRTFWLYMLLYAVSRYVIEIFRGDPRGTVGMFSTSQFISVMLAPLAIVMLVYLSRRAASRAEAARQQGGVKPRSFTVPDDSDGVRLDRFLVSVLAEQSRSQIQRLIKRARSRSAAGPPRPTSPSSGQQVAVDVPEPVDARPEPEALPLPILYQDSRPRRRRQAGRDGRAPGRGACGRDARERAACIT